MIYFNFLIVILAAISLVYELKRDLMMLQQNSYRNERYVKWLSTSGDTTSAMRLTALIIFFVALTNFSAEIVAMPLIGLFACANSGVLASKKYKLPLKWTNRVKRLFTTSAILSAAICCGAVFLFMDNLLTTIATALMGCYCASHLIIMSANVLLRPVESSINKKYYNEASAILRSMPDLKVIGITGSYGKTSTKHYLHRILSEQYDTLMTPGNFNTTLGVIRTVREHLKPYNEVFIVEMGAKQIGDIKEICDLVHPQAGIVTAVGPQHLESFKSIENVQRTKFELIDSLPADGFAVVNNDFEKIADREVENVKVVRYAIGNKGATLTAKDIKYTANGTDFTVADNNGWELKLHTRLVGECNISNLLAAVAIARHLGVSDDKIKYAVGEIAQVEHRLSIKRSGGVVVIDDAYNSNPVGSTMALDVLSGMTDGQRVVVTPGMIELGDRTYELNKAFGEKIAKSVDKAVIVGKYNREAISEGIKSADVLDDSNIYMVDSFAEAQNLLKNILKTGDTVLYENDLPDTFK